jgi:nucleoside phosphorylase
MGIRLGSGGAKILVDKLMKGAGAGLGKVAIDKPVVDIGLLTIRDDEFRAVLKCFPDDPRVYKTRFREYALRSAEAGEGKRYRIAILRQIEQGNGEAQEAARDFLDELDPALLLVVGIAGGVPSDDFSLGDIVLSTRILDFSVEARKFGEGTTYNIGGGAIAKSIAAGVANLGARENELGQWWDDLPAKPAVSLGARQFYGPAKWQRQVREKLNVHFGKTAPARPPLFSAGPIASSDRLVKDPKLLFPWITTARGIQAVEMESAGVHRATRERTPMLSIRALSDIVGFKRNEAWTKYACAAAAAFAVAYLRTQPVPLRPARTEDERDSASARPARPGGDPAPSDPREEEEAFSNLIPLRHFPETLYIAPTSMKNAKQAWAVLNKGSGKGAQRVPGAWTLFESNLYSLIDPERCGLKRIIDIGGLDRFESRAWAFSEDPNQRRLWVYLLNAALREDLWGVGVRYHRDQDVFAFTGHPDDDEPRRLKYANLKLRSTATVVAHYESPSTTGKTHPYLRHTAFQGRFRLLGGTWYLEITPTYRFTYNGKDLDRRHPKRLAGIKRLERNRSVLSQLLIWQAMLRAPWTRADRERLLEFAPLASFRFASEVDESTLTALDAPVIDPMREEELES